MTEKKFYTVQEAAIILNWSESGIKKLIYNNSVLAEKKDRKWFIDSVSIQQIQDKLKGTWKMSSSSPSSSDTSNVSDTSSSTSNDTSNGTCSDTSGDTSNVKSDDISSDTNNLVATLLSEKDKQIEFLKQQLENAQFEKLELIHRQEKSDIRKDVLLKSAIDNISIFKDLNKNIINSITFQEKQVLDILQDKINIAIIEDNHDTAELIKLNLEKEEEDYSFFIFDNVTEPTPVLDKFHVILLDLNLEDTDPIKDAEKWIDLLKLHDRKIPPIIIISGEEEERIEKARLKINPVAVFTKPLKFEDIKNKIKELVGLTKQV